MERGGRTHAHTATRVPRASKRASKSGWLGHAFAGRERPGRGSSGRSAKARWWRARFRLTQYSQMPPVSDNGGGGESPPPTLTHTHTRRFGEKANGLTMQPSVDPIWPRHVRPYLPPTACFISSSCSCRMTSAYPSVPGTSVGSGMPHSPAYSATSAWTTIHTELYTSALDMGLRG